MKGARSDLVLTPEGTSRTLDGPVSAVTVTRIIHLAPQRSAPPAAW